MEIRKCKSRFVTPVAQLVRAAVIILPVVAGALLFVSRTDNSLRRSHISRKLLRVRDGINNGIDVCSHEKSLLLALRSDYYFERGCAIVAVRYLGSKGCFAASLLIESLHNPDRVVRREAVLAISELGPCAADAAPQLAKNLKDESGDVAAFSARALSMIGPAARPYLQDLVEASRSSDILLRDEAARAVERMSRVAEDETVDSVHFGR